MISAMMCSESVRRLTKLKDKDTAKFSYGLTTTGETQTIEGKHQAEV